jgi:hypothetical protein
VLLHSVQSSQQQNMYLKFVFKPFKLIISSWSFSIHKNNNINSKCWNFLKSSWIAGKQLWNLLCCMMMKSCEKVLKKGRTNYFIRNQKNERKLYFKKLNLSHNDFNNRTFRWNSSWDEVRDGESSTMSNWKFTLKIVFSSAINHQKVLVCVKSPGVVCWTFSPFLFHCKEARAKQWTESNKHNAIYIFISLHTKLFPFTKNKFSKLSY